MMMIIMFVVVVGDDVDDDVNRYVYCNHVSSFCVFSGYRPFTDDNFNTFIG
jgi:hypothetical protein